MIGERDVTHGSSLRLLIRTAEALDAELAQEGVKYLEGPHSYNTIMGHV